MIVNICLNTAANGTNPACHFIFPLLFFPQRTKFLDEVDDGFFGAAFVLELADAIVIFLVVVIVHAHGDVVTAFSRCVDILRFVKVKQKFKHSSLSSFQIGYDFFIHFERPLFFA